jgi:AcrR family transcriptional regulator
MGRKPSDKLRTENHDVKRAWIAILSPLYLQNGLKQYSMDDVASHLGISKATLYKYYASRQEILEDILADKLEQLSVFKAHLLDLSIPYEERYFKAVKAASMLMAGISNQFLAEVKESDRELWRRIKAFQADALEAVRLFYEQGIQEGILHDANPAILTMIDKMFIRAVSDPKFLLEHKLELQSTFEAYFLMKHRGIFKQ